MRGNRALRCFWISCCRGCCRIVTDDVGQSPPFAFVNLVLFIERAFVGIDGDLNDLVAWLSGFLQFCDHRLSGRMVGNSLSFTFSVFARVLTILPSLCSLILDFAYQTSFFGRCIMVKHNGPEVHISDGRLLRNSSKSLTGSREPLSLAHISWSIFRCFAVEPPVRDFVGFSLKRTHFAISSPSIGIQTTSKCSTEASSCNGLGGLETRSARTGFWSLRSLGLLHSGVAHA